MWPRCAPTSNEGHKAVTGTFQREDLLTLESTVPTIEQAKIPAFIIDLWQRKSSQVVLTICANHTIKGALPGGMKVQ
jgi:hypothetical protein